MCKIGNKVKEQIALLEKEELRLFWSYNRHSSGEQKLEILSKLTSIITQLEALKLINEK